MGIRHLIRLTVVALILAMTLTSLTAYGGRAGQSGGAKASRENTFQIHFLNQGRVDAILIVSNGEAMFIDSGFRHDGLECINYMQRMGITRLRYYVGTHAHKNHIGGAAPIIYSMRPDRVFIPHTGVETAIIDYAVEGLEREAVASVAYTVLSPGDSFRWNDLTITCLGPLAVRDCPKGATMENYNSLILRIDRGDRQMVLLTGDTSSRVLNRIEKLRPGSTRAEILKNPHHNGAQSEATLRKISPRIVAVCNSSLPSRTYKTRILKIGAVFYTASRNGDGNFVLEDSGGEWDMYKT